MIRVVYPGTLKVGDSSKILQLPTADMLRNATDLSPISDQSFIDHHSTAPCGTPLVCLYNYEYTSSSIDFSSFLCFRGTLPRSVGALRPSD